MYVEQLLGPLSPDLYYLIKLSLLGTIQVLRQQVFEFFRPTHPPTSA